MTAEYAQYLAVGAGLFILGGLGFLTRRNLILMVLSVEMMLHGVSLSLVTFSRMHGNLDGQVFTIFILTVAACEAALALALILALYQRAKSLDVELWTELREPGLPPPTSAEGRGELPITPARLWQFPVLTPAGRSPTVPQEEPANATDNGEVPRE